MHAIWSDGRPQDEDERSAGTTRLTHYLYVMRIKIERVL